MVAAKLTREKKKNRFIRNFESALEATGINLIKHYKLVTLTCYIIIQIWLLELIKENVTIDTVLYFYKA